MSEEKQPAPEGSEGDTEEENGLVLDADESQELQEVFSTIFPQYLIPLEELVGQLLEGQTSPQILDGLLGAVSPLASAADSIGVTQIKGLLDDFRHAVESVAGADALTDDRRDIIIDVFYRLKEAVQTLGSGGDSTPSPSESASTKTHVAEPTANRSDFVARLRNIEGIGSDEVQSMLAAGITTSEQVSGADPGEIAAVTGMALQLAERIHSSFGGRPRGSRAVADSQHEAQLAAAPGSGLDTSKVHDAYEDLVAVVRERVRLNELLNHDMRALARTKKRSEDLKHWVAILNNQLRQGREELDHEREFTRRADEEMRRLQNEIRQTNNEAQQMAEASDTGENLQQLQDRLSELHKRIAWRMQGG